jgi:hypothetical protein
MIGILDISKIRLFADFNNFNQFGFLESGLCAEYFGFAEKEVNLFLDQNIDKTDNQTRNRIKNWS